MSRILNDDDEAITNQYDILTGLATFYTNLYSIIRKQNVRVALEWLLTRF